MRKERAMDLQASMEVHVIVVILVLGGLWDMETEAVTETEEEGRDIEIVCAHSNAYTNGKYFCKGACGNEDVLIHTAGTVPNGRYNIRDEGNTFYVTISHLTTHDSGLYWCGVDRVGVDTYTRVDLTVTQRAKDPSETLGSIIPSSMKLLYIGVSLGVVVLGLAIGLIIFMKHRNRDRDSKSTGQDHNPVYATPSKQRQHAPPDNSTSAVNENLERDGEGATTSEGGLFYSSVSFNKHTDCSVLATDTPTVTYSVIKHKPSDDTDVYCNV